MHRARAVAAGHGGHGDVGHGNGGLRSAAVGNGVGSSRVTAARFSSEFHSARIQGREHTLSAENQGTLAEVLDVFELLLQHHESRLCLELLEELRACKSLSRAPLDFGDSSFRKVVAAFLEGQSRPGKQQALIELETHYHVGSRDATNNIAAPKPPSPNSLPPESPAPPLTDDFESDVAERPNHVSQEESRQGGAATKVGSMNRTDEITFFSHPLDEKAQSEFETTQSEGREQQSGMFSTKSNAHREEKREMELYLAILETGDEDDQNVDGVVSNALAVPTGPWMIQPNSTGRLRWDLVGVVFIVMEAFLVPLSLAFDVNADLAWFWLSTVYFLTDLVSQFFTGYYYKGNLIMKQRRVCLNYCKGFFAIDLIATLPWEYMVSGSGDLSKIARVGKLLRLFRLLRVLRLRELVDRIEDLLPGGPVVLLFSLLKMLMIFAVICHWVACCWGFLGSPEKIGHPAGGEPPYEWDECEAGGPCEPGIEGTTWLHRYGLDNHGVATRYLVALQFSAGLLMGADWGVSPGFWSERVFVIIMMIFSFFLCSLVLSEIVVIVNEMSQSKKELSQQIMCMKTFMRAKKLPASLQAKVRKYLEYKHTICTEQQQENRNFMDSLSHSLRFELLEHVHGYTILHCPFFQEVPHAFLQRVCNLAVTVLCAHHDIVVHRGHRATCMFFIVKGRLSILAPQGQSESSQNTALNTEWQCMAPPSWIGYLCFFQEMIWPSTAVSLGHSELLRLDKSDLLGLLEDFPTALDRYKEFQLAILRGDLVGAGVKCALCDGYGHSACGCPSNRGERKTIHKLFTRSKNFKIHDSGHVSS